MNKEKPGDGNMNELSPEQRARNLRAIGEIRERFIEVPEGEPTPAELQPKVDSSFRSDARLIGRYKRESDSCQYCGGASEVGCQFCELGKKIVSRYLSRIKVGQDKTWQFIWRNADKYAT